MAKTKGVSIREISPEVKGINFDVWGGIDNFLAATSVGAGGVSTAQQLRRVVPWLAKATDMTANAISALPFDIVRENGEVYDTSADWQNKIGGMGSPEHIFYLLASSLCLGRAYLIPDATSKVIVDFQYVAPHTVEPRITGDGLQWFDRTTDEGKRARYYPADMDGEPAMMYFWLPDSDVEIGPAQSYPAGTALMAANLLFSMDGTLQTYAERGFIPPTVLGAKGMPSGAEREKAENWWDRFFKGKTGVTAKIINTEALSIVKVGAGFEDLRGGYTELTKQAIENIGTAYGIPSGLFMSDMAFATEIKHLTKVWYSTSTFVKIYKAIEHGFNTQILNRWNLELKFRPDAIDAMQEEEMERATAFSTYVNAGVRPSIAAEMLGIELPAGMKYEMLDADLLAKQEQEQRLAEAQAARFQPQEKEEKTDEKQTETTEREELRDERKSIALSAEQIKELNLWRQVAERKYRKGKGTCLDFEVKSIPDEIAEGIRERLKYADSLEDIGQAFEVTGTPVSHEIDNEALKTLADAINRAVEAEVIINADNPA